MPRRAQRVPQLPRSKYNNRKTEYKGHFYDSAAEARQAWELDVMKDNKRILDWERQVRMPIRVNGIKICDLVLDFRVYVSGRDNYFLEVKGMETAVYKLKLKLFRACYPNMALHVVKV